MDVLIVDDAPEMLLLLEHAVMSRKHNSVKCSDAECALKAFQLAPFPLILLDWEMSGMNGIELIPKIRELPGGEVSYIVLVTGKSDPDDLRFALEAGANDYITKPFDYEVLDVRLTVAEQQCKVLAERYRADKELATSLQHLASSREDMRSILNQICIGTVLTDDDENIRFMSLATCAIFGMEPEQAIGKHWEKVFPFKESDLVAMREMAVLPSGERCVLPLRLRTAGKYFWVDVMVRDDPRGIHNRIFVLNDVTEVYDLREQLNERATFESIVGKSPPMMMLYQQIQEISNVDITVMICGETGAGKELVAKAIHSTSHRSEQPFIAVNCAGLTDSLLTSQLFGHQRGAFTGAIKDQKGLFEEADGGTLFLDEIGEISMNVQTALLRVLQEREVVRVGENRARKVDVRLITATNRDLPYEVEQGNFRADLMYRIRVAEIRLPPLRQRLEDILY
ncbi:MAG: sigma-54-dependent Fis family transcriptional regulator [Chromatiales bacterium]|nr:sigma-54-dependent Fis family transcriptional regulator [Chromatiales bacterium]